MAKNPRLIDLTGTTFGEWSVLHQEGNTKGGGALWRCRCTCGSEKLVVGNDLRNGKSASCGHLRTARIANLRKRHGGTGTRLYETWKNMRARCANVANKDYGGRGIIVCSEWQHDFEAFRSWAASSGYRDDLSIERKDVNGNYEPSNCTWAGADVQSANRRFVFKAPDGELWRHKARKNGISDNAYIQRVHAGWPIEQAVTWPMGKRRVKRERDELGHFV